MPVLKEEKKEEVNHPQRYADSCSIECIEVMEVIMGTENTAWFCLCNAFKYMWRYKNKNGAEDIDKARWYLDWIEHKMCLGYTFSPEFSTCFVRIKDLYITIQDKISNHED